MTESDYVHDYICNEKNISSEQWLSIVSGLNESDNYCDCLAAVYVGNDIVFFAAPYDIIDERILAIANKVSDSHRLELVAPKLEDYIPYEALKIMAASLQQELTNKNDTLEEWLDEKFNTNEMFELLGFYDENGILADNKDLGDAIDFTSSAFDSFYKSPFRIINSVSLKNIRYAIISTNISYIEYAAWHRMVYPDSTFLQEMGDFVSTQFDETAEYVMLDLNDRLNGTTASQGELCGEVLFDIFLDISIAKAAKGISEGYTNPGLLDDLDDIKFKDVDIDGNNIELKLRKSYRIGYDTLTVTLRPANHEKFASILSKIDRKYKSEFLSFLNKSQIDADDIIERFSATPKQQKAAVNALNSHFDDFVKYSDEFGNEFIRVFTTYPQYADDIIRLTDDFGKNFIKLLNVTHADEVGEQINLSLLESFRLDLINSGNNNISKVCVAFDSSNPLKRGIAVNGSYFKNGNLLGTNEIASGADSILDSLYKAKYGDEAFKNITDYTDYYKLSMSDEYLDLLPDSYYNEIGISRSSVKTQMEKLREAIENTKQLAINEKEYNSFGKPSFERNWNVENCAETWSVRQAILNGAEWDKITFSCVNIPDGVYWNPCDNCKITFKDLL